MSFVYPARSGKACARTSPGDYIWLAYSVFFFLEPVLRNNALYWVKNLAVYGIFLGIYILYHRPSQRHQLHLIGAMALLGGAALPLNPGATCFCTYAAAFLPFVVESAWVIATLLGIEAVLIVTECVLLHESWISAAISVFMIAVVGASNTFIAQKKRANARLSLAHEEIERLAAISERERIARDLHDVLGHTLSVVVLKSELAGRLLERDPERARQEIADVERTARTALAEVREAIGGYRSQGLGAELDQARRTLSAAGVSLRCDASVLPEMTTTEETVLSLAVREATTNIIRHARATACCMRISTLPEGERLLLVEDDGASAPLREGNGLRGMRERVEALGGRLSIGSGEEGLLHGTMLRIQLPGVQPRRGL